MNESELKINLTLNYEQYKLIRDALDSYRIEHSWTANDEKDFKEIEDMLFTSYKSG